MKVIFWLLSFIVCLHNSQQESKTPYELAMEQNHPNVAAMIADLRDNGPGGLAKYEKKKQRSNTQVYTQLYV